LVDGIGRTQTTLLKSPRDSVAHVGATLSVRTISGHVAGVAADSADDVGSEVALLGAIVLAMSDLTTCACQSVLNFTMGRLTVLTSLVLIIA
jgi:hypothetical protein